MLTQNDGHSSQEHHVCHWLSFFVLFSPNHTCSMYRNDSKHQIVLFSDWLEALCLCLGLLDVIFWWITREENDRYKRNWDSSRWGVYMCVRAAWETDKVRKVLTVCFPSPLLLLWDDGRLPKANLLIPGPCGAPRVVGRGPTGQI